MKIDIQTFKEDDIDLLMSWVSSHWELVLWAGHYFGYPLDRTHFESHYDATMEDLTKRRFYMALNADTRQPLAYFEYDNINDVNQTAFISRLIVRPDQRREKRAKRLGRKVSPSLSRI